MDAKRFLSENIRFFRESEIRRLLSVLESAGKIINFGGGIPDLSLLPLDKVKEAFESVIEEKGFKALQYSPTPGVGEFRDFIRDFTIKEYGIKVLDTDDTVVFAGSQQALDLIARALITPGDYIVTENPTYLAALNAFRPCRPRIIGVDVDNDGMKTEVLEGILKKLENEGYKVKFVYTVPTNSNPLGATMNIDRRKHLLELASRYDFLIIEDDPYKLLTFEGEAPRAIKSMDGEGRVIFLTTVSKILAPGLRVAWAIGDKGILNALSLIKQVADLHTSTLNQYLALEMLKRGVHKEYLSRVLPVYRERRNAMLDAIESEMPSGIWHTRPRGGFFVFVKLNMNVDASEILKEALKRGVAYVPGKSFYVDSAGVDTMRLSYSCSEPSDIREGIRIIAEIIKEYAKR